MALAAAAAAAICIVAAAATTVLAAAAVIATATMVAAATTVAAAAIAATPTKGLSLVLTANQGDADEGEKHRHSEHNNAVHPRILHLLTGTSKREHLGAIINSRSPLGPLAGRARCDLVLCGHAFAASKSLL
jgi:hypothetical protein